MDNLRNRVEVKIVRSDDIEMVASPSFAKYDIFGNDLAGIHTHDRKLLLNKPVDIGMTILENSKILMYRFFYNCLKEKYGPKCELINTDTGSLLIHIQTEDVYKDMAEEIDLYHTSNYPKDHPLYSVVNEKVLGKMKDECEGRVIKEAVAVRPKKYQESQGGEKKCGGKRGQARALQRSAFREKAILARNEYSSQRGPRDIRHARD